MKRRTIIGFLALASSLGMPGGRGAGQIIDPGNSPHENVAQRGARAPGLVVRAGIAGHVQGPEITEPAPVPINLRENLLIDLIQNLLAALTGLVPLIPSIIDGDGGTPPPSGGGGGIDDIVMTEIANDGSVTFVELLNRSAIEVRLDGWRFSDGMQVSPALPVIELDRNATLVVQLGGETQRDFADILIGFRLQSLTAGELALYDFSEETTDTFDVEDESLMVDYVEWSNAEQEPDPPLEAVAVAANLWSAIDYIETSLSEMSFRLDADAESRTTTGFQDIMVVAFDDNTLGMPESQLTDESGTVDESATSGETVRP